VLIGIRASAVIAVVLAVAGTLVALLVSFGLYGDYLPVILLSASLPGFLAAWIAARGDNGQAHRTSAFVVQFTTLLVTVAACVVWPFYLCVVLPLVSLSRLYYRARFDVSYPGPAKV
jgi:hypothetical protein